MIEDFFRNALLVTKSGIGFQFMELKRHQLLITIDGMSNWLRPS
jgi:hypothetical protein